VLAIENAAPRIPPSAPARASASTRCSTPATTCSPPSARDAPAQLDELAGHLGASSRGDVGAGSF
jgi:hypothetical protein